jgi:hypothetical protein
MGPHDRQQPPITALGRFWDEFLHGRPASPGDLDSSLAETVRHLHARDDVPGADAAFTAHLSAQLEDQMNAMHFSNVRPADTFSLSVNGRDPARAVWPPLLAGGSDRRRGWPVTPLVSAALVLLTFVFAFFAFGPPRHDAQDERLTGPPSAVATPATPSPSATNDETLVTVTVPAGALPAEVVAGLNHYTVAPGSEATWDWTCCSGVRLDYILEGTYAVTSAGPMQLRRAGSATDWEDVRPGTEVVLEPGDALLSRMEDSFDAVNFSSSVVNLLDVVLLVGNPGEDPVPHERSGLAAWEYNDLVDGQDIWLAPVSVPAEPMTLRLRQTSIDATSELAAPSDSIMQLAISLDEGAVSSTQEDFAIKNYGPDPIAIYALTLEPAGGTHTAMATPSP